MSSTNSVFETRENIPLQKGRKHSGWCGCNEEYLSGVKFINVAFGTLTVIITIALLLQIYYGDYQVEPHGSVATDSLECSKIGTSVLKKGGNAIDAAIASAFCLAVVAPHLTGLDGEGLLLIYNHRKRFTPDVYDFSGTEIDSEIDLPRMVIGLAYIHQQYASLPWKNLLRPAADLAKKGFPVSKMLAQAVQLAKVEDVYGRLEAGQIIKLETLSNTLKELSNTPEKELYTHLTPRNQPIFSQALRSTFNNYNIYVPGAPSAGPELLTNLQQLEHFNFTKSDTSKTEYTYRVAEVTQNIYTALNISAKFHMGTATNIAVMDLDDNYVSFTTGLYSFFGTGEITVGGYTLDVKYRDRSCSRLSLIITDSSIVCGRRMVLGGNDVAVVTQLALGLLVGQENVISTIEAPRFHIMNNGSIGIEESHTHHFNEEVLQYLETLTQSPLVVPEPYMSSNIVEKVKDDLNSHSDSRGGGISSRF